MLEWYRAGTDYQGLMEETEELLRVAAGRPRISYRGRTIELTPPFERLSVAQAFERYAGCSMDQALAQGNFDELMVERIEPNLGLHRPCFIYDYPASLGALARLKKDAPNLAERFELYLGGLEIANAFSELTDPDEQRSRFKAEAAQRAKDGKAAYPMPEKFLEELEDLPASAGIALGLDRLVMVLLDAACIDEVVAFTTEEL